MTANPLAGKTLTVTPVVDYEPPPRSIEHQRCSPPVRQPRPPDRPSRHRRAVVLSPAMRAAAAFADAALRRVLEVIDRRRPPSQLRCLLAAGLVDSVLSMSPAVTSGSAATLQRLRLQAVGSGDPPEAVEVFGSYTRGRRTHAVACRVEPVPGDTTPGWQIVALHIG